MKREREQEESSNYLLQLHLLHPELAGGHDGMESL